MGECRNLEQTSDLGESIGGECTDPRIGKKLERKARIQIRKLAPGMDGIGVVGEGPHVSTGWSSRPRRQDLVTAGEEAAILLLEAVEVPSRRDQVAQVAGAEVVTRKGGHDIGEAELPQGGPHVIRRPSGNNPDGVSETAAAEPSKLLAQAVSRLALSLGDPRRDDGPPVVEVRGAGRPHDAPIGALHPGLRSGSDAVSLHRPTRSSFEKAFSHHARQRGSGGALVDSKVPHQRHEPRHGDPPIEPANRRARTRRGQAKPNAHRTAPATRPYRSPCCPHDQRLWAMARSA